MALKQLSSSDVLLGVPLEKAVYSANGRLLLNKGTVLNDPATKQKLLDVGHKEVSPEEIVVEPVVQAPSAEQLRESVFSVVQHAAMSLGIILQDQHAGLHGEQFIARVRSLAARLQIACKRDAEAAIAAIHLYHEGDYSIRHHLSVAIVCTLLADADGRLDKMQQLALTCAALTHDVGILKLTSQDGELSEESRRQIKKHPLSSSESLKRVGVTDPVWLEAVLQHHERLDGSGYPHGLAGSAIGVPGSLLAVADVYCAMTRPRPYRNKAYFTMAAMRDLYVEQSKQLDGGLIQLLIKVLGLIPPGSIVKLKNGEVAVVKQRCTKSTPMVYSLYNREGMPMMRPEPRNTALAEYQVQGRIDYSACRSVEAAMRSIWA